MKMIQVRGPPTSHGTWALLQLLTRSKVIQVQTGRYALVGIGRNPINLLLGDLTCEPTIWWIVCRNVPIYQVFITLSQVSTTFFKWVNLPYIEESWWSLGNEQLRLPLTQSIWVWHATRILLYPSVMGWVQRQMWPWWVGIMLRENIFLSIRSRKAVEWFFKGQTMPFTSNKGYANPWVRLAIY